MPACRHRSCPPPPTCTATTHLHQVRLENPHVVSRQQVWCGVVPAGPSGQALNSSYQNRDNAGYRWAGLGEWGELCQ